VWVRYLPHSRAQPSSTATSQRRSEIHHLLNFTAAQAATNAGLLHAAASYTSLPSFFAQYVAEGSYM
jgi:hypothetical protein